MIRLRSIAVLLIIALVAAACSGTNDEDNGASAGEESGTVVADAPGGAEGDPDGDGGEGEGAEPAFDYASVDYDAEPVESALRGNRSDGSFPPPLVDIGQIRSGGPGPDGIFPIDAPTYAPIDEIDYEISDGEAVVAVEIDGDARAFPVQLMIWHEIVNTEIGGTPVTVTYCPLCNSALTFDRRFGNRVLDFGTSGELYQSALVMYDRQSESLWAHFTGTGLVGHYAGATLELIPTQTVSYGDWKAANPDGLVLTRNLSAPAGYLDRYGRNPYAGYDDEGTGPFGAFFSGDVDPRLLAKARIVGIVDEEGSVAVRFEDLIETPVIPVTEGGRDLVVFFKPGLASALDSFAVSEGRDVGQSGVFVPASADGTALTFTSVGDGFVDDQTGSTWNILGQAVDGPLAGEELTPVAHTDTFWFAWATYQPDTVVLAI